MRREKKSIKLKVEKSRIHCVFLVEKWFGGGFERDKFSSRPTFKSCFKQNEMRIDLQKRNFFSLLS
jgi:hypothetical protein